MEGKRMNGMRYQQLKYLNQKENGRVTPPRLSRRLSSMLPSTTHQKFTEQQKKTLASFSSVNYLPTDSALYKQWLRSLSPSLGWDRWLLILIMGVLVGMTAVLMRQCLDALDRLKWDRAKALVEEGNLGLCWLWTTGISIVFVLISTILVWFVHPPAHGPGVPETISFLNGVVVHGTLSLRNFLVKFTANVLAVSSGLPCAIQGPIIALGAIVGAGVGQFRSKSLGFNPKVFSRFRNPQDRRDFTTAGVAAGVAAAFNAPIGGLLFAMEDISSFWSRKLSWHTFLCSGIAAATAQLLNTAFSGFQYGGEFGMFSRSMIKQVRLNIAIFAPSLVLGLIGGILGAGYTRINLAMQRLRKRLVAKVPGETPKKIVKILEPAALVVVMTTIAITLPLGIGCSAKEQLSRNLSTLPCYSRPSFDVYEYTCDSNSSDLYNEGATLLIGSGGALLGKLASRGTEYFFSYASVLSVLPLWFIFTAWTAGTVAGGIFVPTLISGALYGRAMGLICLDIYRSSTGNRYPVGEHWSWVDPGVMAIIGSASLLGGVTRLTLAVTVIIVEMAQDISLILPVLVAIFVAKLVADLLSKPLYKYLLDMKSMPYLEAEPVITINKEEVNMDLYRARDVMQHNVLTIKSVESVAHLSRMLRDTKHGGFPVIKYDHETRNEHACGLITRRELLVILMSEELYNSSEETKDPITPDVSYDDISVDYIADQSAAMERVRMFSIFEKFRRIFINLEPFIDQSAMSVDQDFSLRRTYTLFRTLGLRHLMVTDMRNRVVGLITRKDLMPFHIAEKLMEKKEMEESAYDVEVVVEATESDTVLPAISLPPLGEEAEQNLTAEEGAVSHQSISDESDQSATGNTNTNF